MAYTFSSVATFDDPNLVFLYDLYAGIPPGPRAPDPFASSAASRFALACARASRSAAAAAAASSSCTNSSANFFASVSARCPLRFNHPRTSCRSNSSSRHSSRTSTLRRVRVLPFKLLEQIFPVRTRPFVALFRPARHHARRTRRIRRRKSERAAATGTPRARRRRRRAPRVARRPSESRVRDARRASHRRRASSRRHRARRTSTNAVAALDDSMRGDAGA